jgi:exopolyphosphatase/guanosine-5'-triphosphate,3'-diphosphate pyrophosphatase
MEDRGQLPTPAAGLARPSSASSIRAVIDVGTNSVKLLVADVTGGRVHPLDERSHQTRLGRDFYETHRLQPAAIQQTALAVAEFALAAQEWRAGSTRVIATSAARDAENKEELLAAIQQTAGLPVEIISGEQEAEWVFRGVTSDPNLAGQRLLILDVGGGSTEFVLGAGGHHACRQSFPLGAVRLLEKLRPGDPPSLSDLGNCRTWLKLFFNQHVAPALESSLAGADHQDARLVGTGGTTTILARMAKQMTGFEREQIEGTRLGRRQVLEYMVHLWSLSLAERRKIVGLPPNRADIILTGVAIYEAVMEHFHFEEVYVSTRGLRFGAALGG